MAKKIIKYSLNSNGTIPDYVDNGGYFPVGNELVGLSVEDEDVPEEIVRMNKADLLDRLDGMTLIDDNKNPLDSQGKADMLDVWLEMLGMSDLA